MPRWLALLLAPGWEPRHTCNVIFYALLQAQGAAAGRVSLSEWKTGPHQGMRPGKDN